MRLVGREKELAALHAALGTSRLVTIVGMAGVGKSRLAAELAAALEPTVITVDVSSLEDGHASARRLEEAVAGRPAAVDIVVVDGCEGGVELVAAAVARVLARDAGLRCVATSRRPLRLADERLLDLEPLAVPLDEQDLPHAPASALFFERARHEVGDLPDDAATAAAVVAVCARLGGLPLALELAARRLRVMSVTELAEGLARGLEALGEGHRDAPARHRRLDAALGPSLLALGVVERSALGQATVFEGWFSLASARRVLDLSSDRAKDPVDALEALVDHALLARRAGPRGALFRVHEVVRAHLAARAEASVPAARVRHDAAFVERADPADGADLVAAVERGVGSGSIAPAAILAASDALADDAPIVRRLALLDAAIVAAAHRSLEIVSALLARAEALGEAGRADEARADRRRAEELAEGTAEVSFRAAIARARARLAAEEGRVDEAVEAWTEDLSIRRARADREGESVARLGLASARRWAGDLAAAEDAATAARSLAIAVGVSRVARLATIELAKIALARGDATASARFVAVALAEGDAGDASVVRAAGEVLALGGIVRGATRGEQTRGVRATLLGARRKHRAAGFVVREARASALLGLASEVDGDLQAARSLYGDAASSLQGLGRAPLEGLVLACAGRVEAAAGRLEEARALLDAARAAIFATGVSSLVAVYDLAEAELDLAEGGASRAAAVRRARSANDVADAHVSIARALLARRLDAIGGPGSEAIVLLPSAAPSAAGAPSLVVARSGRWFEAPGGERVALGTRRALRLMLAAIARARADRPGDALDVAALLDAGWPGERVLPSAGATRVYGAVAQLRRAGLDEALLRRDDGYLLDPAVGFELVED